MHYSFPLTRASREKQKHSQREIHFRREDQFSSHSNHILLHMYRAFNLVDVGFSQISVKTGEELNEQNQNIVRATLAAFLTNGKIDGSRMRDHWFPQINADVFISHSHFNKESAIKLSSWLYDNFTLTSFIDSCVWGLADDLLKQIDNAHCKIEGENSYSYERRNGSTSHVHMMLSTALAMMLDRTECVFFLNTRDSITSAGAVKKTNSPWIYYELSMISLIRRPRPERMRTIEESFGVKKAEKIPVEYLVELGSLTELGPDLLNRWRRECRQDAFEHADALDSLYQLAPEDT